MPIDPVKLRSDLVAVIHGYNENYESAKEAGQAIITVDIVLAGLIGESFRAMIGMGLFRAEDFGEAMKVLIEMIAKSAGFSSEVTTAQVKLNPRSDLN